MNSISKDKSPFAAEAPTMKQKFCKNAATQIEVLLKHVDLNLLFQGETTQLDRSFMSDPQNQCNCKRYKCGACITLLTVYLY